MANRLPRLLLSLVAAAAFTVVASPLLAKAGGEDPAVDRFIVGFTPGSEMHKNPIARGRLLEASAMPGGARARVMHRMAIGADVVRTNRKLDARAAQAFMNRLRRNPDVSFVEIDQRMKPSLVPNDPLYGPYQWHYYETTGGIGLPAAWDLATGAGVVVAVVDSGITSHSDLAANVVAGYDFITDLDTAQDGDGRDADPSDPGDWAPADACDDGEPESKSSWHGTHVAGTVAAVTNNAKGVAGVAFNAKVMPLRALGRCGGSSSDIADAIIWAVGGTVPGVAINPNPAEVINLSLGGPGTCGTASQSAINFAVSSGAVIVVAAGNDGEDASAHTPANCQNVIVVGATSRAGGLASYSNFGSIVDVSAPGGDSVGGVLEGVASTFNSGPQTPMAESYAASIGTSMAAPHVAGTVALMQSLSPGSAASVESILKATARPLPLPCSQGCGSGIINAPAAIAAAVGGVLTVSDFSSSEGNAGQKQFVFTVVLSKAFPNAITFDVATANGSAAAGSDYVALSLVGQSIPAGQLSKSFNVAVNGDTTVELTEDFYFNVSNVVGVSVGDGQGRGVIANDDATALVNGVPVTGIAGPGGQQWLYSLAVPSGTTSLVFEITGGSGDSDLYVKFGSLPTTSVFDCTSRSEFTVEKCTITSPQVGTYYVLLDAFSALSGVSLVGQFVGPAPPGISVADVSISEGNAGTKQASFTISLSATSASAVTFDVATGVGTAAPGSDFVEKTSLGQSIAAGQTSGVFAVTINGDTAVENHETFTVNLANVVGATVVDAQGMGRITNDDVASLSIGDVAVTEGNSGQSSAVFTIRLSSPTPNPVTFNITTGNGTATSGSDYVARSQTGKYIDAGRTTALFEVNIIGDGVAEANETFSVSLSSAGGAIIADGTATGTILNDDAAAAAQRFSVAPLSVLEPTKLPTSRTDKVFARFCNRLRARGQFATARARGCSARRQ